MYQEYETVQRVHQILETLCPDVYHQIENDRTEDYYICDAVYDLEPSEEDPCYEDWEPDMYNILKYLRDVYPRIPDDRLISEHARRSNQAWVHA